MALPKADTFTGTTGVDLDVYNAGWVQQAPASGAAEIDNNKAGSSVSDWCSARWTGDGAYSNDQYAQGTVDGANYCGVQVRMTGLNGSLCGYVLWVFSGSLYLYRHDNSAAPNTVIASAITGVADGDVIKISAVGTAIHAYKNGVEISGSPWTDSTYASGSAGVLVNNIFGAMYDWEGGNVGGGGGGSATGAMVQHLRNMGAY